MECGKKKQQQHTSHICSAATINPVTLPVESALLTKGLVLRASGLFDCRRAFDSQTRPPEAPARPPCPGQQHRSCQSQTGRETATGTLILCVCPCPPGASVISPRGLV